MEIKEESLCNFLNTRLHYMNIVIRYGMLIALVFLLVSAASASALTATISTTGPATPEKPFVSATASAPAVPAGGALTISGTATGIGNATGNVTSGVQIWIFSDNYGIIATAPVAADSTYSYPVTTTGMAPGMYYVFIQNPVNGGFAIMYNATTCYAVNTVTGQNLFRYSNAGATTLNGTETVRALTNALNDQTVDDIYSKLSFTVTAAQTAATTAPAATAATSVQTTAPATAVPISQQTATKVPLSPLVPLAGIGIAAGALLFRRAGQR
jgi:ribosomal protein L12E/L44/L45/RPP1/RPP2